MTIEDILNAIAALTPAQRETLMRSYKARWCVHCGRQRNGENAQCECGGSFQTDEGLGFM
jgi:hypothetical protein